MDPYKKKEYQQSDKVIQAQQALQQHQQARPGEYQSQYQKPMQDLQGQILNRGPFKWDPAGDAFYHQAVDQYTKRGQMAMADTVGQVTALTGGYGNSYAQTAGQQAYQGYLQQIAALAPQYQQMALERYQAEGDDLASRYGILAQAEQQEYGRYNDNLNRWLAEQDRLQGTADREADRDYQSYWQNQNFDYGVHQDQQNQEYRADRDALEDKRYQEQLQHQLDREKIEDERWQKQWDEDKRRYDQEWAARQAAAARGGGGGGGRGSSRSGNSNGGWVHKDLYDAMVANPATPDFVIDDFLYHEEKNGYLDHDSRKGYEVGDYTSGLTQKVNSGLMTPQQAVAAAKKNRRR